jgi:hypothetical protein
MTRLKPRDLSESLGKLPPQALDLEESVLGALLLEGPTIPSVAEFLKPEHFYSEQHKEIYQAILDQFTDGKPTDMRSIVVRLRKTGKIELIGGASYIAELTSKVSSAASVDYHARVVMEMALKRELIQIASEIHHKVYEDTADVFECIANATDKITKITEFNDSLAAKSYMEPDVEHIVNELDSGEQTGKKCHILHLEPHFKWTKGTVSAWYGWPGDGKGTFYEFISVVNAMHDNWVYCMAKPEDLNSKTVNGVSSLSADNIYRRLAWIFLGKPTLKLAAKRLGVEPASSTEVRQALKWVKEHFIVVHVKGNNINMVMDSFAYQQRIRKNKIDVFNIDPWTAYEMEERGRGDYTLRNHLWRCKSTALLTNTRWDIITHPNKQTDPRVKKGGAFRVVDQYMINGGTTWDNACDQQFSIHQPERHLNKPDGLTDFWNLKQKAEEFVGCVTGQYEGMRFHKPSRRYLFNNVDPITGTKISNVQYGTNQYGLAPVIEAVVSNDDLPF